MSRSFTAFMLLFASLVATSEVPAQTIEWWDRAGEAYRYSSRNTPRIYQVKATPAGIYSVGEADCREDAPYGGCKGLLSKYDPSGGLTWRVLADVGDAATIYQGVDADENGIYVIGTAIIDDPRFGPGDWRDLRETAFVQRYTHDGVEVWRTVDWFDGPRHHRIKTSSGCSIVVDDTGIYTTTGHWLAKGCGGFLRKLSFDGELLWLLESEWGNSLAVGEGMLFTDHGIYSAGGEFLRSHGAPGGRQENGLAYYDGALYTCSVDRLGGHAQGAAQVDVYKTDLEGNVVWQVAYPKSSLHAGPTYGRFKNQTCAMAADANGVYLTSNLTFAPPSARHPYQPRMQMYRPGLTVRRWDHSGVPTGTWDFPSMGDAKPVAVSVLDEAVYVSGHDPVSNTGFTARISADELLEPSVISIGREVAVLDHHYGAGAVSAIVRAADASGGTRTVEFSNGLRPIDWFSVGDLNGNGADDLGVLSRNPAVVEVVDFAGGEPLLSLELDADFEPVAAVATATDASNVIAVLMRHRVRNELRLEEFDAHDGTSLRTIAFDPNFEPLDVLVVGSGESRRYVVLHASADPDRPGRLEINDGTQAVTVRLGPSMVPEQALVYMDGAERIAVLRRNAELKWQDIAIVDPEAGAIVQVVPFSGQFHASDVVQPDFVHSPDIDLNLAPQFSVAGHRDTDNRPKIETRDVAAGALLNNAFLNPGQRIQDLVYLGAESGVSTPSIGILMRINKGGYMPRHRRYGLQLPYHRYSLVIVDLLTGMTMDEIILPNTDVEEIPIP